MHRSHVHCDAHVVSRAHGTLHLAGRRSHRALRPRDRRRLPGPDRRRVHPADHAARLRSGPGLRAGGRRGDRDPSGPRRRGRRRPAGDDPRHPLRHDVADRARRRRVIDTAKALGAATGRAVAAVPTTLSARRDEPHPPGRRRPGPGARLDPPAGRHQRPGAVGLAAAGRARRERGELARPRRRSGGDDAVIPRPRARLPRGGATHRRRLRDETAPDRDALALAALAVGLRHRHGLVRAPPRARPDARARGRRRPRPGQRGAAAPHDARAAAPRPGRRRRPGPRDTPRRAGRRHPAERARDRRR